MRATRRSFATRGPVLSLLAALWFAAGCSATPVRADGPEHAVHAHQPEPSAVGLAPIAIDRRLAVLPEVGGVEALSVAARELGDWKIEFAGVVLDGVVVGTLAAVPEGEPPLRYVRETLRRPVDLEDFIYFLDDVLVAGRAGRRGERFTVSAGRARSAGILLHPDDIFRAKPRRYAEAKKSLAVDVPPPQASYEPAADGDPLGPRWTARFANPVSRTDRLDVIAKARPKSDLPTRLDNLLEQLEAQGADVWLTSTVRSRERGYLMWGAFELSRAATSNVEATAAKLDRLNEQWALRVPIKWRHPNGTAATVEAARSMADAYQVVYATERGAKNSSHYYGRAVDFVAIALPRSLRLESPAGEVKVFDLSAPASSRDLSLSPALIAWVESAFALRKLPSDYPHWTDTAD